MKQNNIFFRYFSPVAVQQKLYAAALVALLSFSAYEAEAQVGELSFIILLPLPSVMESIIPLERVKAESGRRMAGPGRVVLFVPAEERLLMC